MDRRGLVESGGAAVACALAAAATFQVVAGTIDWVLVLGIAMCAAIAASANYRARVGHSEQVADEVSDVSSTE